MSFDENPPSPDKVVNPEKRTTKVNIILAVAVLVFLALGGIAALLIARNSP